MAGAGDSPGFQEFDMSESEEYDYDFDLDVQCKRCGVEDLHWYDVQGKWVLFDSKFRRHVCKSREVTFEDET